MKEIRLAIVGTGGMANGHAETFRKMKGCRLVAVCDISEERVKAFAAKHKAAAWYTDFGKLLREQKIDAVSVVASDAAHKPLALKSIAAGKHVLCEKPLAVTYPDAKKMADAASKAGVINMVNFSYRNSYAIHKAAEIIRAGKIGRVIHFEASYLQSWLASTVWGDWRKSPGWLWRLSTKHGSNGVLGDIGVHIVDFAGYPVGEYASVNCRLRTFDKAKGGRLGDYILDANDSVAMTVEMKDGALGVIHTTRWATGHKNSLFLRIYGDRGAIQIDLDKTHKEMQVCLGKDVNTATWKTMKCPPTPNIYERFIRSIRTGKQEQPDFARGAAVQKVLDAAMASDKKGSAVRV